MAGDAVFLRNGLKWPVDRDATGTPPEHFDANAGSAMAELIRFTRFEHYLLLTKLPGRAECVGFCML